MIVDTQAENNNNADDQIFRCINLEDAKSFFLFAGAGSGKTRSLVSTLKRIRKEIGLELRISRKKVGVITYTNGASDEIKHRLDLDPLFSVSTIHHFVWELIKPFTSDIKEYLKVNLNSEIKELKDLQSRGRAGTKAAVEREISIRQKTDRLANLGNVSVFKYSPTGENRGRDALNHSEVISITSKFLLEKPLLQKLLVRKYPILFIDESQDTNKNLIESFFKVQSEFSNSFTLGLFGDTMQRIYFDGKPDLGVKLPDGWIGPEKTVNYRCATRIVKLINQIRSLADGRQQIPHEGQDEGFARLFIIDRSSLTPSEAEEKVANLMADIAGDKLWTGRDTEIKVLTLEHHMAASRMGFLGFFQSLSEVGSLRTGLIDGTFPGISFFTKLIIPLIQAESKQDSFAVMRILKDNSPILNPEKVKVSEDQLEPYREVRESSKSLFRLWDNRTPTLEEIVENIYHSRLFDLPQILSLLAESWNKLKLEPTTNEAPTEVEINEEDAESREDLAAAWDKALKCSFSEVENYGKYVEDSSRFGTHQGVKGREFERVMVIIDDVEARGFSFSFDRVFGVKAAGDSERRNLEEGRETIFDRTLRLFYVACSRAEKSLAIVAYTDSPNDMKSHVLAQNWFTHDEITIL